MAAFYGTRDDDDHAMRDEDDELCDDRHDGSGGRAFGTEFGKTADGWGDLGGTAGGGPGGGFCADKPDSRTDMAVAMAGDLAAPGDDLSDTADKLAQATATTVWRTQPPRSAAGERLISRIVATVSSNVPAGMDDEVQKQRERFTLDGAGVGPDDSKEWMTALETAADRRDLMRMFRDIAGEEDGGRCSDLGGAARDAAEIMAATAIWAARCQASEPADPDSWPDVTTALLECRGIAMCSIRYAELPVVGRLVAVIRTYHVHWKFFVSMVSTLRPGAEQHIDPALLESRPSACSAPVPPQLPERFVGFWFIACDDTEANERRDL